MGKVSVAPSILAADPGQLANAFASIHTAERVHLDIMDGHFVPNMSFGPWLVKLAKKHFSGLLDTHLMVTNPEEIVPYFIAEKPNILSFHVEATHKVRALLESIEKAGIAPALAINPETPIQEVFPYLDSVKQVLVMSVHPGFGGQAFMPDSLARIAQLQQEIAAQKLSVEIAVDGGIDLTTAPQVAKAGATVLVAGSSVFGKESPSQAILELSEVAVQNGV